MQKRSFRDKRIGKIIQNELSKIFLMDIKNPKIEDIVITNVKVAGDLSTAKIYFSSYNKVDLKEMKIELDKSKGFILSKLGLQIKLRKMPSLGFHVDDSLEYADKISRIMEKIHNDSERDY